MGFNTDDLVPRQFDTKTKQAGANWAKLRSRYASWGEGGARPPNWNVVKA